MSFNRLILQSGVKLIDDSYTCRTVIHEGKKNKKMMMSRMNLSRMKVAMKVLAMRVNMLGDQTSEKKRMSEMCDTTLRSSIEKKHVF